MYRHVLPYPQPPQHKDDLGETILWNLFINKRHYLEIIWPHYYSG